MDTHGTLLSNLHLLSLRLLETQVEPPLGSPTASSIRGRAHSYDLHEQLTVHRDSRFLAALIFSLFFFVPARGDSKTPLKLGQSETRHFQELEVDEDKV